MEMLDFLSDPRIFSPKSIFCKWLRPLHTDRLCDDMVKMETVLNSDGDQIQRMQSVIRQFKPVLAKLKDRRQRTAARYNVFEALGVERYEPAHSRHIAYLLDPTKPHDQGDIFLISFLKCLGLNFCRSSTQDAEVSPEFNLDPHSRIDIHIRLANGQIILIENKISAAGRC